MAKSSSFPNRINKETSNVESSIEHEEDDGLSSSQKKNISDKYAENLSWSKRALPEAFELAVTIEEVKHDLNDIFLTTTKDEFALVQKKKNIDEFNKVWHNIANKHELWRLILKEKQLKIDHEEKINCYREIIKKSTTAFASEKIVLEKLLAQEKRDLTEIEADRLSILNKVDELKKRIKSMKKIMKEGERKSEVQTKDFERYFQQTKENAEKYIEQVENLEKQIVVVNAEIETMHDEKIEYMFSGTFDNASESAMLAKEEARGEMKKKEVTRLENKLQLYREEGERLSEEINKVEADKQKIHGKMSIRKFTSAAREADVKRLRQGVKTTEEKLLKIRKESRVMKRKLRDLKEKDLLTPILLAHITNESDLVTTHLNVTLEDLDDRSQELSAVDVEYQRLKTKTGLEKGKTFHIRMKKEEDNLRKEIQHMKDEEELTIIRMEKLQKQESKIKDEMVELNTFLELKKINIHNSKQKTLKCQTDIYRPKRQSNNGIGDNYGKEMNISFHKEEEESGCGIAWGAHPLQLKFNKITRTFYQFQEEKAECAVKLETTIDFAKNHIAKQKKRWDKEQDTLKKRMYTIKNRYLMNLEDIEIQKQRLIERKQRSKDTKIEIKLTKKDIKLLQKSTAEKKLDLGQVYKLLNDLKHQYKKILQPQLKKQQKENSKFNDEVKRLSLEDKDSATKLKEKIEVEETLSKETTELDHDWEELTLERDGAKQAIEQLMKQSNDLTGPIHATEVDRDLQSQIAIEMQTQQLDESKELSRIRKENSEIRMKIDDLKELKRKTENFRQMHETGEWTQIRLKLNKQISGINKKSIEVKEQINEMTKVINMLEKKVERARHSAEASKRTEMAKLKKQLKGSVMKHAGILQKQKGMKGLANMIMAQRGGGMAGMMAALKSQNQHGILISDNNNNNALTKVEKDIVSDDTGKKSVLSAFKQINNINNGGSTNNHNDSGGGSTAGIV